jgi:hypothetical protein
LPRRSAILLLAVFSFSLLIPAFNSDRDANLPACCRRDGKHHCSKSIGGDDFNSGASFQANAKCPMHPGIVLPSISISGYVPPVASLAVPDNRRALPIGRYRTSFHILHARTHYKRGPPSLSIVS